MPVETPALVDATQLAPDSNFVDVETLTDSFGIRGVISQRRGTAVVTFAIFKVFERGGRLIRTSFVGVELAEQYKAMFDLIMKRIPELHAAGKFPFKELPRDDRGGREARHAKRR